MGRPKKKKEVITDNTILKKVMSDINKEYKKPVIKFAKEEKPKDRLPFNIKEIDELTGGGAICGNYIILYGGESVGKTSACLQLIGESQKNGKTCALIDIEHSWNEKRAKLFGVDSEKLLLISDIDNAEQAMDILINLSKNKVVDLIVVDSIQAMSPKGEQLTKQGKLKSIEDDEMALLARKMSKFLRVSNNAVYSGNVSVVLIGQVRTGGLGSFVVKETLTGGRAQGHWAMYILYFRRGQKTDSPIEKVKEYYFDENNKERFRTVDKIIGFPLKIKLEKTKSPNSKPEGTEVQLPFYFENGFYKNNVDSDISDIKESKVENEEK